MLPVEIMLSIWD